MRQFVVSILVLTLVVVLSTGAVVAQEASPAASPAAIPEPLATWAAALAAGDPEGIVATYTEDAVFEEVPIGVVTHGQDELRAHLDQLQAALGFSQVVTDAFVAGDWAAAEWVFTGTYSGQFPGLPPGMGQSVTIRGTSILQLEGGKIREERAYWDAYGLLVAVGAVPAPQAAATPAA